MTVTIIGLGLIGGSLGLSLKALNFAKNFIGVDINDDHKKQAIDLGIVDECLSLEEGIEKGDVIFVTIPVNHIVSTLPKILDRIKDHQLVIDLGSTKSTICKVVTDHPKRGQFVAAHPMAGTENTGPSAAFKDLFQGKMNIICEREKTDQKMLERAIEIFHSLEMNTTFMDGDAHDKHIAYVSHLSHVSSFTLALTVLDIEHDERNIFNMAGSGFESTVRLAKSSPDMWGPIFAENRQNISESLESYITYLEAFKGAIDRGDQDALKEMMGMANGVKRVLKSDK